MPNTATHDGSENQEVVDARSADEQESLLIGQQLSEGEAPKLAGKYESPEELEKAYLELQQKLGQQPESEAPPETPRELTVTDRLNDAYKAFQSDEGLKEDDLKAFEEVSKEDLIKAFFGNQTADDDLSDAELQSIYGRVGSEENYRQMIQWASQTLEQKEVEAFDAAIDSGDMQRIGFAVDAVARRFYEANGQDGELLQGKAGAASNPGFRSQAELIRAMQDPRYEDDPAYRADVFAKLERSPNVNF